MDISSLSRRNFLHAGAVASEGLVLGGALAACSSGAATVHQDCGAVKASLKQVKGSPAPPGDIPALLVPILPAAQSVQNDPAATQLDAAIQQNVRNQVAALNASTAVLQPAVTARKLKIVGAVYQLASGRFTILD
ncbi:MAG: carbonic anhydrase [Acidimicrobiaceae bacterium]|jgi:carbonic anhydrase|nr:carbonic anhydrase [Acidimicrobiaceae bacterium]